jgi:hypothetical protein
MEPEIARRCGICGAAVRGAARFCPQCGQSMAGAHETAPQVKMSAQPALVEEAERVASSLSGRLAAHGVDDAADANERASVKTDAASEPARDGEVVAAAQSPQTATRSPSADDAADESRKVQGANDEATIGVRQRAAAVGAGVGEALRPRVDRLRERSVVVLDEAADDPGLRFVLVTVALFVVALLLYVFSFVLR